ncbi:imm11 family protein [Paenibacillus alvei]|uniref:imm11 family protein n=1 Tax=Paenibacillus alvei TaxID=44250 RepID=UPI00227F3B20|nr:DUF1629 domain-containing protein [Paenibacillus alvei]
MKIWKMLSSLKSMEIEMENDEDFDVLYDGYGKFIEEWGTPKVVVTKKGRYQDFPILSGGNVVFNQKSMDKLGDLLINNAQILDVNVNKSDIDLKIVHVLHLLDAVDYNRSIPHRTLGGIVNGFNKLIFNEEAITSHDIFKIPELFSSVFVSDKFRDTVLASKLKGFEFYEVWDSEITEEMEKEDQLRYEAFLDDLERNKGAEMSWSDAVACIEKGKAVASGHWKLQFDKRGEMRVGRLSLDCKYSWSSSPFIPPLLLTLVWHEVAMSDI